MTAPSETPDWPEHFAHCIQVFGGTTSASRRLGIDERALRRFVNGEKQISERLLTDTTEALRSLAAEATAAEARIAELLASAP